MKPKNILLYVDASKESRAALDVAVDYSGPETTVIQLTRSGEISLAEAEVELEENGWCYLYDAEEIAKSAGASIVILQESGYPEEVLPRLASEYGVDLIIIGHTPGLGQASLAQQLIEHAPCAVLVVK